MFGLDKITPGKVLKAGAVGVGVFTVAALAPIGAVAVTALTVAGAGASWAADSIGDEFNGNNKDDKTES
ncbi:MULTISPECIES: hypothetical protein [Nostoc]|uniref:Uncharacterized protein n=1 Tax=Nostoc paludosum FACHB-159 TaxID=2692908 RepID=A0ABR8KIJ2_9NOSO|nr:MULTISPECIES: hypothetical protein [Nostoc]MBD2682219.1 hypothetical protein [Nostoc sp. FACHB-857]MBD2738549.1 hypothetical protein [Nostoc paludosum FACHB-159]